VTIFKFYFISYVIIFIALARISYAQDTYTTQHGVLYLTNNEARNPVKFHSNEIHILLNMRTAEFNFSIPIKLLHSEIDSLNNMIKNEEEKIISLHGFLNLEKVDTQPHNPYHFKFESEINYGIYSKNLDGIGELEHIPGEEQPACQLNLSFDLDDFELFEGLKDDFRVIVVQSILYQSGLN